MKLAALSLTKAAHAAILIERVSQGRTPTIAVDFDGTIATHAKHPAIGGLITKMRRRLRRYKRAGYHIIIWTCRGNVQQVEDWLRENDVPFDHVNYNPNQPDDASEKVVADLYIDDKSVNPNDPDFARKSYRIIKRSTHRAMNHAGKKRKIS